MMNGKWLIAAAVLALSLAACDNSPTAKNSSGSSTSSTHASAPVPGSGTSVPPAHSPSGAPPLSPNNAPAPSPGGTSSTGTNR
ncbi:MAG TPA: hypothetical protein VLX85_06745 [Stellaceae bacterium]|nr:hypothetical protein [Stellaceae bacterium]